jgi:hypothetical protein
VTAWTCPTCKAAVSSEYCPACGENALDSHDLALRGLLSKIFHAFTDIDGRLLRSFRSLITHPGELTAAYVQGRRMPYIGPFQIFLLANVLFFAVQSLTNTNVVSSTLDSHLHQQDWSTVAQRLVAQRLEQPATTLEQYAPIFDQAVVLNAKSLIILMVLPFALLLPLLFHRNHQPLGAHVVFSLHFYAFVLLLFCASLTAVAIDVRLGGSGLASALMDDVVSVINLTICVTYLHLAIGRVYGARGVVRAGKALMLGIAAAAILLGYRFMLLIITLHTT